jgi:hypothetical protein
MRSNSSLNRSPNRSYSLSMLFVLVAACAIVASFLTPVARGVVSGKVGLVELLFSSVGGGIAIMMAGGVLGLFHYRPVRGALWGIIAGGVTGAIAGPLVLVPSEALGATFGASICGAVLLLVIGAAFRASSPRR